MRKKTIGFNWGAAGLSNSLWTGAPLREVLFKLGVKEPKEGLFVCFEGPERELPKGELGTYGDEHSVAQSVGSESRRDDRVHAKRGEVEAGSRVSGEINHSRVHRWEND